MPLTSSAVMSQALRYVGLLAVGLGSCQGGDRSAVAVGTVAVLNQPLCEPPCRHVVLDTVVYRGTRLPIGRPTLDEVSRIRVADLGLAAVQSAMITDGRVPADGWMADTLGAVVVEVLADSIPRDRALVAVISLPPNGHFQTWFASMSRRGGRWAVDTVGRYYVP